MKKIFFNFLSSALLGAFGAMLATFICGGVLIAYSNSGSPNCNGCNPEWSPKMTSNEFWHMVKYFFFMAWAAISVAIIFLTRNQSVVGVADSKT